MDDQANLASAPASPLPDGLGRRFDWKPSLNRPAHSPISRLATLPPTAAIDREQRPATNATATLPDTDLAELAALITEDFADAATPADLAMASSAPAPAPPSLDYPREDLIRAKLLEDLLAREARLVSERSQLVVWAICATLLCTAIALALLLA